MAQKQKMGEPLKPSNSTRLQGFRINGVLLYTTASDTPLIGKWATPPTTTTGSIKIEWGGKENITINQPRLRWRRLWWWRQQRWQQRWRRRR